MKISEFQLKDVVNVTDGKRLGNIIDLEINLKSGKIEAVVIQETGGVIRFLKRDQELIVPWENILKIGEDVILVRLLQTQDLPPSSEA